jgi:hypothetical protein
MYLLCLNPKNNTHDVWNPCKFICPKITMVGKKKNFKLKFQLSPKFKKMKEIKHEALDNMHQKNLCFILCLLACEKHTKIIPSCSSFLELFT